MAEVWDVLVLGAGMAGLAAARALAEAGLRVLVLEVQERVGGRILTETVPVKGEDGTWRLEIVELGAEFVHGQPPALLALLAEAGLETYERVGTQASFAGGRLSAEWNEDEDEAGFEPLERLSGFDERADCSFLEFLERAEAKGEELEGNARALAIGYVEGFNAADAGVISVASLSRQQAAENAIEGDRVWCVKAGYARLPEFLADRTRAAGGEVRLGADVARVEWSVGDVAVELSGGEILRARRLVVTLPLGVLKAGTVRFSPTIERIEQAAAKMRMGQVCRFTLVFHGAFWRQEACWRREALWQDEAFLGKMRSLSFLFSPGEVVPVWWTAHPAESATLTGWVGGPRAEALRGKSAVELGREACEVLGRIFGMANKEVEAQLLECRTYEWGADRFAQGAYSYVAAGGVEASAEMCEPIDGTLFFAGEHTDTSGHWGTVHGALRSGLRAAVQVLQAGEKPSAGTSD